MLQIYLGSNLRIPLQLSGGEINQYPQVLIYNSAGTLLSTNNMVHLATGLYTYLWTPPAIGNYIAVFKTYTDVGHTVLSVDYGIISDNIVVLETLATLVDYIWDEILTGATHNVPTSSGRRLRQLGSTVIWEGTAQGPGTGTNQIQLDLGASSTNDVYDTNLLCILVGTGVGQTRTIITYNGTSKIATVNRDWNVLPGVDSEFVYCLQQYHYLHQKDL